MPSKHAKLSPSSADRWIHCPGSVSLSERVPPQEAGPYAEEGTIAHAAGELKLRKAIGEITQRQYAGRLKELKKSEYWCGEMDECTDFYAAVVLERLAEAGPDAELMVEQELDLSRWVPDAFGTSDAVIVGGDRIEVVDLKYGKRVEVEAAGNPQLRLYGLGAYDLLDGVYDIGTVGMTIIQPRRDHISVDSVPACELIAWAGDVVAPAAQAAMDGTGEIAAGDWCRWCPAKAVCRRQKEEALAAAKDEFKEPPLLQPWEIGDVLRQAKRLKEWVEDIEEYALKQALSGEHYDGWKLVEGRSIRRYADDLKVAEKLKAAGYDEAVLYERKLYGITAMEKIVGKKKLSDTLGDLLIKPPGKPTLVPEDNKREAINTVEEAREDFK